MATTHFRLLDGLRGAAAIAVVAYHFGGRSDLPGLMPRGYLAVDFFFVLSGLVVAHAYLDRLKHTLTTPQFLRMRVIRLWPMLVPGTLFGAAIEFWRPDAGSKLTHFIEVLLTAFLGCLALPWPFHTAMEQTIFPINGPVWSLFFEIVASLVFVMIVKSPFTRPATSAMVVFGAGGLLAFAFASQTVDIGALLSNWPGGLPRVLYSFFVGVLLSAYRHRIPAVRPFVFPLVLLGVFMVPVLQGPLNAAFDLVVVLAVFPALVASASNCTQSGRSARLSNLAGELSYPLYAIHYPIIRAICFIVNKHPMPAAARIGVGAASIIVLCGLSLAVLRFYDRPLRRLLTAQFIHGRTSLRSAGDDIEETGPGTGDPRHDTTPGLDTAVLTD